MLYLYADITITPYSEVTCDVLTALLGEVGYDSFEVTDTGIKAYIPEDQFDEEILKSTLADIFIPDVTLTYTLHTLENKDWNAEWEQNSFDPILEREFGIRLNPRMAFGSGSHETTYQITSLLLKQDFTSQRARHGHWHWCAWHCHGEAGRSGSRSHRHRSLQCGERP